MGGIDIMNASRLRCTGPSLTVSSHREQNRVLYAENGAQRQGLYCEEFDYDER